MAACQARGCRDYLPVALAAVGPAAGALAAPAYVEPAEVVAAGAGENWAVGLVDTNQAAVLEVSTNLVDWMEAGFVDPLYGETSVSHSWEDHEGPVYWRARRDTAAPAAPVLEFAAISEPGVSELRFLLGEGSLYTEILRSTNGVDFLPVAKLPAGMDAFAEPAAVNGRDIRYAARAWNTAGASGFSQPVTLSIPHLPSAPTGVVAITIPGGVRVTWAEDSHHLADRHRVERWDGSAGWTGIGVGNAGALRLEDNGHPAGLVLRYRVVAQNDCGDSPASPEVSAETAP